MAFGTLHMVKGDYDGSSDSDSPFVPKQFGDVKLSLNIWEPTGNQREHDITKSRSSGGFL